MRLEYVRYFILRYEDNANSTTITFATRLIADHHKVKQYKKSIARMRVDRS